MVSLFQKPYVETSQSFTVENRRRAAEKVYDYEGYYTLQTANEAAKMLISWLTNPGGVSAVYQDAGVKQRFLTLRSYERAFTIRHAETPFFEVRYKTKTSGEAQKLSASLEKLLKEQLASFQSSDSLSLGVSPSVSLDRKVALMRNLFSGAVLALALAVFGILFRKALESER